MDDDRVSVTLYFFFFKQKTAYEMRISDWSSDVCSSDLQRDCSNSPHRLERRCLPQSSACPGTVWQRPRSWRSQTLTPTRSQSPRKASPGCCIGRSIDRKSVV